MPPQSFPTGSIITVPEGAGLYSLSKLLEEENVIRSPFWFRTVSILLRGEKEMKAGQYYLNRSQSTFGLAWRIFRGDHRIETVKLTIPEGFTVNKISALFDNEKFSFFDNDLFERIAPEGYLFPDTYFVPVTATASSTIKLFRDNFTKKVFPVMPEIELSGRTLEEIIIVASLIEGEANNQEDREMVSDVLWKRLKLGMPLQVDVETKTYEFQGLPERPINNPGLLSIQATLHPTTTPYLYYLTGDNGQMYYSRTFDEHVAKKQQYIQ
ncbi:MAG: endolytic transglycosylase MltG [Candidatus Zambryskibacteria bacterium]|nr:endolytic transglycosylase MltG [Candidatus Zambryskibacteria bacterium]